MTPALLSLYFPDTTVRRDVSVFIKGYFDARQPLAGLAPYNRRVFTNAPRKDDGVYKAGDGIIRADIFLDAITEHFKGKCGLSVSSVSALPDRALLLTSRIKEKPSRWSATGRISVISAHVPEGLSHRCFSLLSGVPLHSKRPFAADERPFRSNTSYLIEDLPELIMMTLIRYFLRSVTEWR